MPDNDDLKIVAPIADYVQSVNECLERSKEMQFEQIVIIGVDKDGTMSIDCDQSLNCEGVVFKLMRAVNLYM